MGVGSSPFQPVPLILLRGVECMKKIISVFSVVLVLVFSCVLTSFADDGVVSGYAVDNVPYNESFGGVLTSSDSGSQLYSSSENRTYNFSSVLSAPSSSSDSVYHFKSVTGFIPTNTWRGSNSPVVSFPTNNNGYSAVYYKWSNNTDKQSFYHYNSMKPFSNLQGGRRYRVSFSVSFSRSSGSFSFYLANQSSPDTVLLSLFNLSQTINMSNSGKSVSIDFTLPEGSMNVVPVVKGYLYQSNNSSYSATELAFYINDFTITDITTEDLDKSLDKLGNRLENSINPSVPYNEFDDGSFKDSAGKLKEAGNALPTVDFNAIDELANSVDVSSYAQAFSGMNQLFIRVVDTIGVTPLIFFACFFGFCIFLIGRKLSGG